MKRKEGQGKLREFSKSKTVEIYHRLIKYPPWALKRRPGAMKIVHQLHGGRVEYTAKEYITPEDSEVLYAALYLAQNKQASVYHATIDKFDLTAVSIWDTDLMKLLNTHNRDRIIASLRRLRTLTISFHTPDSVYTTGVLHSIKYDFSTGTVSLLFPSELWHAFSTKTLTLNLDKYLILSPAAKNLYQFLYSNSASHFNENTLIQRTNIESSRMDNAQAQLHKALNELAAQHIIAEWKLEKCNGIRYIRIDRNYPQH